MHIGIALPNGIPGVTGDELMEWARKADEGPFSSVAVLDRIAHGSYEPLTVLAAAAAITRRVQLATIIAVSPLRNTALLAKSAASIDALSNGRLVLGLAVGAHEEDYAAVGVDHRARGKRLAEQLVTLRTLWNESTIGPKPVQRGGPPILLAGYSDQAYIRIARSADGLVGGTNPQHFAQQAEQVRAAWTQAERSGTPQLWALSLYALGADAVEAGRCYVRDYYAFAGPAFVEEMQASLLTSPQAIAQCVRNFEDAGCDELVFFSTITDITQLDRLASVIQGIH